MSTLALRHRGADCPEDAPGNPAAARRPKSERCPRAAGARRRQAVADDALAALAAALEAAPVGVLVTDADGHVLHANGAAADVLALPLDDVIGADAALLLAGGEPAAGDEHDDGDGWGAPRWLVRHDGASVCVQTSVTDAPRGPSGARHLVWVQDVTRQRRREERWRREALSDPATGLANRRRLERRLARELQRARAGGRPLAVLLADLDHFKEVNDSLGHQAGDHVLAAVAARLEQAVRPGDLVARLGGDEFVLLCPGADVATAQGIADRVAALTATEIDVDGRRVRPEVSVGVAVTTGAETADAVLARADASMYGRKRARPARP
ncbi:GGDEF domain-containing protein [Xylanimonas oleitrophica]|uniref:GGDEF domain-containing protein n=1 Tax=Xylanimonas oleitrophica TaxID=2607479 RepID=UPI0015D06207|nr:GGDEF domain-containing protein [Xylanimonas oleitrophica]